jgi:hypothetical protein
VKSPTLIVFASLILALPTSAQKEEIPKSISESVGNALGWAKKGFFMVAEAMPESKYSYTLPEEISRECVPSGNR